jgi:IS5 family transposase
MRPKQPKVEPQEDLFRARLQNLVDLRHPLAHLAKLIDWGRFEVEFGALYMEGGRPGLPTCLRVGLHLLKHMDRLSDEAVCARYLDSPYAQLFCGETYFQRTHPARAAVAERGCVGLAHRFWSRLSSLRLSMPRAVKPSVARSSVS